jgi:hypothetical protein
LQFQATVPIYSRITVLRRMPGSNETGAHTIDFGGVSQAETRWSIDQSDANVSTSGSNGSGAVVQSATGTAATATTVSATLGAFASANNGTFGAFGGFGGTATAWTPGTGFTELSDGAGGGANDVRIHTSYRSDNDTTVDATINVTTDYLGAIGIEVAAASAASLNVAQSGQTSIAGTVSVSGDIEIGNNFEIESPLDITPMSGTLSASGDIQITGPAPTSGGAYRRRRRRM